MAEQTQGRNKQGGQHGQTPSLRRERTGVLMANVHGTVPRRDGLVSASKNCKLFTAVLD